MLRRKRRNAKKNCEGEGNGEGEMLRRKRRNVRGKEMERVKC